MSKQTEQHNPSLAHEFVGGPLDGRRSADLPPSLSGQPLTGMVIHVPLSQPHWFALRAVYVCQGETPVDGFWQFVFQRLEGPNGELLSAAQPPMEGHPRTVMGAGHRDSHDHPERTINRIQRADRVLLVNETRMAE